MGKPVPAGQVVEDAKQFGYTQKTLRRAAEDMGVIKDPPGGGRNCTWRLPDDVLVAMNSPAAKEIEAKAAGKAKTRKAKDVLKSDDSPPKSKRRPPVARKDAS
jgi:hypothetical protein